MKNSLKLFVVSVFAMVVALVACSPKHSPGSFSNTTSLSNELFNKANTILKKDCTSCHRTGGTATSFELSSAADFVRLGLIVPGNPQKSKILFRLKNFDDPAATSNNMPPGGYQLSDADYQVLYSWVLETSSSQTPFACDETKLDYTRIASTNAKRLSLLQYQNTLSDLLTPAIGSSTTTSAISAAMSGVFFPEDTGTHFKRENNVFNGDHAQGFFTVADRLAQSITTNATSAQAMITYYINLSPGTCTNTTMASLSANCRDRLMQNLASRFYRRPLRVPAQNVRLTSGLVVDELTPLSTEFANAGSSQEGLNRVLFRLMLSPHFLTQLEDQNLLMSAYRSSRTYWLSSFAVANRLSYRFWNSMPDSTLWTMAMNNELDTDEGYLRGLNYVLSQSPKLNNSMREYFNDWLKLDRTPQFTPNPRFALVSSVNFDSQLRTDMINEMQELGSYVVNSHGSFEDLFTSNISFARSSSLMSLYGQSTPAPQTVTTTNAIRFPAGQRAGILTRGAYLISGSEFPNPIVRGYHIRRDILCMNLGTPPANALDEFNSIVVPHVSSTRTKVQTKTSGASCVGCHNQINPLGFALSNYNSFGSFMNNEPIFSQTSDSIQTTVPVDSQVDLSALFGGGVAAQNALDYSELIAGQQSAKVCFAEKVLRYSMGRAVDANQDACRLNRIYNSLDKDSQLMDAFRSSAMDAEFRLRHLDP